MQYVYSHNELSLKTNLGDKIKASVSGSVFEGIAKLIGERGVTIKTDTGDRFVKWVNVKEVRKV